MPLTEKQALAYSEPSSTNGSNSYEESKSDIEGSRIVDLEDYEDESFLNPPKPDSPQSQLRDLCKRGDPVQLENFLQEMCVEEIEQQEDKDLEDQTVQIRRVDKLKVSRKFY